MGQRIVNDMVDINNLLLKQLGPEGCNITRAASMIQKNNDLLSKANITVVHKTKVAEVYVNGLDIGRIVHLISLLNGHIDDA